MKKYFHAYKIKKKVSSFLYLCISHLHPVYRHDDGDAHQRPAWMGAWQHGEGGEVDALQAGQHPPAVRPLRLGPAQPNLSHS